MCMAAILYAGISTVVYGASITQAKHYLPQIDIASPISPQSAEGADHSGN